MATSKKESTGPFWVQDKKGNQFAWPFVPEGAKDTGESPFDGSGNYRANRSAAGLTPGDATAAALSEGNQS